MGGYDHKPKFKKKPNSMDQNTKLEPIVEETGDAAPSRPSDTMNEGGDRKKFRIIKIKKNAKKSMLQTYQSNMPKKNYRENSFSSQEDEKTTKMKSGFEGGHGHSHGHSHAPEKDEILEEENDEGEKWLRILSLKNPATGQKDPKREIRCRQIIGFTGTPALINLNLEE